MKKFVLKFGAMFACFALAIGLAACGGQSTSTDNSSTGTGATSTDASTDASTSTTELDGLIDGALVVGFDQDYPPYGFVGDDGQYTGLDLDLAAEVCARNGWTFTAQPISWDAKDSELNAGTISCIWNGFTMEGREGQYEFSEPYMDNAQVVVVKADSGYASLADLAGKTVLTQTDSAALEVLEGDQKAVADTFATLETRAEFNTAFMELESGACDAIACDLSVASYQMSKNPDKYIIMDERLSEEHYAIGFKLGNSALADQVNTTLKEMVADGTVQSLCEKYAEYGIDFNNWVLQ